MWGRKELVRSSLILRHTFVPFFVPRGTLDIFKFTYYIVYIYLVTIFVLLFYKLN